MSANTRPELLPTFLKMRHVPNDNIPLLLFFRSRKTPKSFAFDHCFASPLHNDNDNNNEDDSSSSKPSDQEDVFLKLGVDILDNAFDGYNACIFAYGQTGSGKSYTMLGSSGSSSSSRGIIPRLCDALFDRIAAKVAEEGTAAWQAKVEVSYMEIYNEKVHDLLNPTTSSRQGLKVREHSVLGPYVDGLSQLAVISYQVRTILFCVHVCG